MTRLTFQYVRAYANKFGVEFQRKNSKTYEYWIRGEDHTIGEASTIEEAWSDMHGSFFK